MDNERDLSKGIRPHTKSKFYSVVIDPKERRKGGGASICCLRVYATGNVVLVNVQLSMQGTKATVYEYAYDASTRRDKQLSMNAHTAALRMICRAHEAAVSARANSIAE